MSLLQILLISKIAVTVIAVIAPLLLFDRDKRARQYGLAPGSPLIFNLYAMALTALLVNYGFGLIQTYQGVFPASVVWVGIISNLGASFVLAKERLSNSTDRANVASALSTAVFGIIGLSFCASLLWSESFM